MEYSDNSDLKLFDAILKDNKVLMLGENTHSDGATFKFKSRLIKYLHENMNYNVILYEAGRYDTWIMNNEMNNRNIGISPDSVGGLGLFHFWWANKETLIEYYQQTKNSEKPIELGGFDFQFSGSELYGKREKLLRDFVSKNKIDIGKYPIFKRNIDKLEYFVSPSYTDKILTESQKEQLLREIKNLEELVLKLDKTSESEIYARYFHDININFQKSWRYKQGSIESMQFRDSVMAKNIIYQIDSVYKNKKIIIWTSNIHTFTEKYNNDYFPLGTYIKKKYGKSSYMLNFSSYAKRNDNGNLTNKPGKFAIENVFHDTKTPYFFIDFSSIDAGSVLKRKFVSTVNQGIDEKRFWSRYFDGILYIDNNTQLTPIKK